MEGHEGETIEWPTSVDDRIENNSATETRKYFFVYDNPLVQLPPTIDQPFRFLTEGQAGSSN